MPYIGKKPADIIATAVDTTTGNFSETLAVTGETTLATHLNMGDNDIIKLGASADLQIYHDGSNSIIKDAGTGQLQLHADNFKIMNAAGTENIIFAAEDGLARLFYDNSTKLTTTSTGIDVTGTVALTAGNVTVEDGQGYYFGDGSYRIEGKDDGANARIGFVAASSEAMRIDSSGNVGIGTSSPLSNFDVAVEASDTRRFLVNYDDNILTVKGSNQNSNPEALRIVADNFRVSTGTTGSGSEALRIDNSGNVGIGDSSPSQKLNVAGNVMLEGGDQFLYLTNVGTGNSGIYVRGNTAGSYLRSHSTGIHTWEVTGSEKMRINSTGDLLVSKTSSGLATEGIELRNNDEVYMTQDNGPPLRINRLSTDGALVVFYQGTIEEGTIEVSGSSVTLAGGHLSRWSQLADNTRDNTIVKGTVMTNLDQMAEWTTDGITEENDQLNCTAVSTVEGDPNVAGVFLKWDDDDEVYTNDMFISMTGDMVIRIAQGTTVARGDLLMSAGDGTAKPQDDDIVRSKTIAKVTSTNVSHTYDDGSYLVPCVLMAC